VIEKLSTRYGKMFVPNTDQGQYWWLANTGASPEDEFIEVVTGVMDQRPKGVAYDVGANFGCWTLPLSKHATRVVAFEPQKCCSNLIIKSLNVNGFRNVLVENKAVGSKWGVVEVPQLDIDTASNFGGISLVCSNDQQPDAPKASVKVVRLDDYMTHDEKVSFIKIDVEGGEVDVLNGAKNTIKRDRPLLMMEMDHAGTDLNQLHSFLEENYYSYDRYGPNYFCVPF